MQTIKAAGPADLIAYAWYRIGYRPKDSIVLVGLYSGPGGAQQLGLVLRVDIPPRPALAGELERLCRLVRRTGHHEVVALIDARSRHDGGRGPLNRRPVARAVRVAARRSGLRVEHVLGIAQTHFRAYSCQERGCCPDPGHPIEEVLTSRTATALVIEGEYLASGEEDLVADVAPVADPLIDRAVLEQSASPSRSRALQVWSDLMRTGAERAAPDQLSTLCLAMKDVMFRDAVLLAIAGPAGQDGLDLARRVLAGEGSRAFALADGLPPDRGAVSRGRAVLVTVARNAPTGWRADILAVLAWLEWWRGNGARGRLYAERALDDVPGHRLAGLVQQVLANMVPPGWARDRLPSSAARS